MIDRGKEFLLAPAQACKVFPGGISLPTYWRYIGPRGVRGVQLESFLCGGKRWTSKEAIDRFISAQNPDEAFPPSITASQRQRQSEAARTELEKMGVSGGVSRTIARPTATTDAKSKQLPQSRSEPRA